MLTIKVAIGFLLLTSVVGSCTNHTTQDHAKKYYYSRLDTELVKTVDGFTLSINESLDVNRLRLLETYLIKSAAPTMSSRIVVFENNYPLPQGYRDIIVLALNDSDEVIDDIGMFNVTNFEVLRGGTAANSGEFFIILERNQNGRKDYYADRVISGPSEGAYISDTGVPLGEEYECRIYRIVSSGEFEIQSCISSHVKQQNNVSINTSDGNTIEVHLDGDYFREEEFRKGFRNWQREFYPQSIVQYIDSNSERFQSIRKNGIVISISSTPSVAVGTE